MNKRCTINKKLQKKVIRQLQSETQFGKINKLGIPLMNTPNIFWFLAFLDSENEFKYFVKWWLELYVIQELFHFKWNSCIIIFFCQTHECNTTRFGI